MSRKRPPDRLETLLTAATEAFIAGQGYQRTQMDDVAKRLGLSKGALYTYVESKEALFDLCVRFADSPESVDQGMELPVKTPKSGTTLAYVEQRIASHPEMARLAEILTSESLSEPRAGLESVVRILYRMLSENRRAIKLVDVAAIDHPDLSGKWFTQARGGVYTLLAPYIERRTASRVFLPLIDVGVSARNLLETCVFWAVHRHWDPSPQVFDEDKVEDAVVQWVARAFLGESKS